MDYDASFDTDRVLRLSKQVLPQNALENIESYNDEMTISQVVRFFGRQGVEFTKTMIQNYVRVKVLPPPVNKRYYTRGHLILLTLINDLKNIYSLDDIKNILQPVLKDIDTFDDDMIDMNALYDIYLKIYKSTAHDFEALLPAIIDSVKAMVGESSGVRPGERDTVCYFMTIVTLMVQSIATKQLARTLIDDFGENI